LKKIFILLLVFITLFSVLDVNAKTNLSGIETQINPDSSPVKIKKLQSLFKSL
jgi:hypothetical protein